MPYGPMFLMLQQSRPLLSLHDSISPGMHPIALVIAILPFSSSASFKKLPSKRSSTVLSRPPSLHRNSKRTGWGTPCGLPGYEEYPQGAFESRNFESSDVVSDCLGLCQKTAECGSFGVGGSSCFLYSSGISGNVQADPNSPFVFYNKECSDDSSDYDLASSGPSIVSDATGRVYSNHPIENEPASSSYRGHSTDSEPDGFETDFDLVEDFTGLVGEEFEPLPQTNTDEDEGTEDDVDEDLDADGFNPAEEDTAGADEDDSGSGDADWFKPPPNSHTTTSSRRHTPAPTGGVRLGHDFRR